MVVTTYSHNLVTTLSQPCHNLVTTLDLTRALGCYKHVTTLSQPCLQCNNLVNAYMLVDKTLFYKVSSIIIATHND